MMLAHSFIPTHGLSNQQKVVNSKIQVLVNILPLNYCSMSTL